MSLQAPGLGATLMTCLRQAGMTEDQLAICVTTSPQTFAAGQTDLTAIIRQIISDDAWIMDDDLLPSFLASCRICLLAAGAKPEALLKLELEIARAVLRSFHGGIIATLNPPVPDDGGDGDGAGDEEGDAE